MGDDSRKSALYSLKKEWSLLWESFAGDEENKADKDLKKAELPNMTLDEVRRMTRELSQERRRLHRRLESLKKELDLNSAKLESLRVVGSDEQDTLQRISDLNDQGKKFSEDLSKLDRQLKFTRDQETKLKEATA